MQLYRSSFHLQIMPSYLRYKMTEKVLKSGVNFSQTSVFSRILDACRVLLLLGVIDPSYPSGCSIFPLAQYEVVQPCMVSFSSG
ncbi:unnamed protein product [Ilex paraguariensis]